MNRHRKGLLAGATGAAAAGLVSSPAAGIAASAASAATAGHRAMTRPGGSPQPSSSEHHVLRPHDTTSVSGTATLTSTNGPVWAIDSLSETGSSRRAAATCTSDNDGANYAVTLTLQKYSRFAEFADPGQGTNETSDPCPGAGANAGGPHTGQGNVFGT